MNKIPARSRTHFSILDNLLKTVPTYFALNAMRIAKKSTGNAVPIPYIAGTAIFDPALNDNGIRPAKKRAAEAGQNDSANNIPIAKSQKRLPVSAFCFIFFSN